MLSEAAVCIPVLLSASHPAVPQAELVAQFLCCIPLATVEVVLAWLKPVVPEEEQAELLNHVSPHDPVMSLVYASLSSHLSKTFTLSRKQCISAVQRCNSGQSIRVYLQCGYLSMHHLSIVLWCFEVSI